MKELRGKNKNLLSKRGGLLEKPGFKDHKHKKGQNADCTCHLGACHCQEKEALMTNQSG